MTHYPRAPIEEPVTGPSCRPLAHTRVYSIQAKEDGMKEGCLLVLAKHRLGAALSRVTVGEDGDTTWANVRGFPCSKGAAAASLLPQVSAFTIALMHLEYSSGWRCNSGHERVCQYLGHFESAVFRQNSPQPFDRCVFPIFSNHAQPCITPRGRKPKMGMGCSE